MQTCNCLNPRRILHPSYMSFVASSNRLILFEEHSEHTLNFYIDSVRRGKILDGYNFFKLFNIRKNVVYSLDSYFLDSTTGETFPVFMDVPCGHCDACLSRKHNGIIQRLNFGFEETNLLTLFVTLTYNEKHLPKDGVCRRDVQLFKKRLNKIFAPSRLKYGYFSEYGVDGRPHYHMVIYGLPLLNNFTSYHKFEYYSRLLQFCWRKFPKSGFKSSERYDFKHYLKRQYQWFNVSSKSSNVDPYSMGFVNVEFPNDGKCFGYISKYISKSSNVPAGKNKNFYNISNHLGLNWLKERVNNIRSFDSKFVYRSKCGQSVKEIYLCSYYIRHLFPSLSQLVPIEFRRGWYDFHLLGYWIAENKFLPTWYRLAALNMVQHVSERFPSLCPILDFKVDLSGQLQYAINFNRSSWLESVKDDVLEHFENRYRYFMSFPSDFEKTISKLVYLRESFLSNYSKSKVDPLITALKFSKTFYKYQSSKKF